MAIELPAGVIRPSSVQTWCASRPLTLFARAYYDSGTSKISRIMIQDALSGFSTDYRSWIFGATSSAQEKQGLTTRTAASAAGLVSGAWNGYVAQFVNANLRRVRINNSSWTQNTDASTPALGTDTYLQIGLNTGGSDPPLADISAWTTQLSDDEVALLMDGVSPRFIRPESLRFLIPAVGTPAVHYAKEDWVVTGTAPIKSTIPHPPIIGPIVA